MDDGCAWTPAMDPTVRRWVQRTAESMTGSYDQVDADGLFPDKRRWNLGDAAAMLAAGEEARTRSAAAFHLTLILRWPVHTRFSRIVPDVARYRWSANGFPRTPPALYLTREPWTALWEGEEYRRHQTVPEGPEGLEAMYSIRRVGDDEWDRITLVRCAPRSDTGPVRADRAPHESLAVVVRLNGYGTGARAFDLKEAFRTFDEADREVHRLNRLREREGTDTRYVAKPVRFLPRGRNVKEGY